MSNAGELDKKKETLNGESSCDQLGVMEKNWSLSWKQAKSQTHNFLKKVFPFQKKREVELTKPKKKQSDCKSWFVHKTGFISASEAKSICTRQCSVEKQNETDVSIWFTL